MDQIISFIESLKVARKQIHLNLTMFPLLAPEGKKPDYLTMEQALVILQQNSGVGIKPLFLKSNPSSPNFSSGKNT